MKGNEGLKMNTIFDDYMKNPQFKRVMSQEELIMEVTETLCEILEKDNISRKELATLLGKSKGFVSQLLNGGRNLTLRTLADVLHVLGYKISLKPYKESWQSQECSILKFPSWSIRHKKPEVKCKSGQVPFGDYPFDKMAM
jgi:transcriptional regulator with XRE-family HTH domain